ncbi:hypothetical protein BFR04_03055 [Gaetbulibacter sp. 4G1]|nr:hypothetical protein BFR04_03055 [Gaetbulibacter sp. 4G1]
MIMRFSYNSLKVIIYIIGLCLTIFSIIKHGLVDSHTPPLGIAISVIFLIVGAFWVVIDYLISVFFDIKISYRNHYFGIGTNLMIIVLILAFTL